MATKKIQFFRKAITHKILANRCVFQNASGPLVNTTMTSICHSVATMAHRIGDSPIKSIWPFPIELWWLDKNKFWVSESLPLEVCASAYIDAIKLTKCIFVYVFRYTYSTTRNYARQFNSSTTRRSSGACVDSTTCYHIEWTPFPISHRRQHTRCWACEWTGLWIQLIGLIGRSTHGCEQTKEIVPKWIFQHQVCLSWLLLLMLKYIKLSLFSLTLLIRARFVSFCSREATPPYGEHITPSEEVTHLRRQVARLNRRVLAVEIDNLQRQQREKVVYCMGLAYFLIKAIMWLNRN